MTAGAQRRLVGNVLQLLKKSQMTLLILCMYQPDSSSQNEVEKREYCDGGKLMFPNVAIPNRLGSISESYIFLMLLHCKR